MMMQFLMLLKVDSEDKSRLGNNQLAFLPSICSWITSIKPLSVSQISSTRTRPNAWKEFIPFLLNSPSHSTLYIVWTLPCGLPPSYPWKRYPDAERRWIYPMRLNGSADYPRCNAWTWKAWTSNHHGYGGSVWMYHISLGWANSNERCHVKHQDWKTWSEGSMPLV